ncbi:hypothetical protein DJ031_06890 [bacterium endosymbiont of Escarpia laminata]|nr:MAG: hypothetical protein DJ031_06890 [bacterium endosymbiont of Escarpia laminata]
MPSSQLQKRGEDDKDKSSDGANAMQHKVVSDVVAHIMMLIGVYGLLLEFYNQGMGLPGILGAICHWWHFSPCTCAEQLYWFNTHCTGSYIEGGRDDIAQLLGP